MRALAIAVLVVTLPTFVIGAALGSVATVAVVDALGAVAAWVLSRSWWRRGTLELTEAGALVRAPGLAREIRREDVEDGWESEHGDVVVLRSRDGSTFEAAPDEPARAILEHLGVSLERRTITAPLRGVFGSFMRGLLTFLGVAFFGSCFAFPFGREATWVPWAAAVILTAFVVTWLRPRVIVGVDGVRIVGVLRPVFLAYGSIRAVQWVPRAGRIELDVGGTRCVLPVIGMSRDQVRALVARIEEGRERFAASPARSIDALDRNARPLDAWRRDIQAAMLGAFRNAAVGAGDLEEVLADPKAPLERRVGAALALRDDEAGRARVRVAAETSADPRVRVALEHAAADELDEAALEQALEHAR